MTKLHIYRYTNFIDTKFEGGILLKIYPLYEFPPSLEDLTEFVSIVDLKQPLWCSDIFDVCSRLYGKRPSRTKITIKSLVKLGVFTGKEEFSLSWETQLYVDLRRNLRGLLLHLIHRIPELFEICNSILQIDPGFSLSNPGLLKELWYQGYNIEKITTAREKIYAIKRLITCCKGTDIINPFIEYQKYVNFLEHLQKEYLLKTGSKFQQTVVINQLRKCLLRLGYSTESFGKYLTMLYLDPVRATFTSFSSVIRDFARDEYFLIKEEPYYYLKLMNNIVD